MGNWSKYWTKHLLYGTNLQMKFDFNWYFCYRQKPLLCVHGFQGGQKSALEAEARTYTNIKFCQVRLVDHPSELEDYEMVQIYVMSHFSILHADEINVLVTNWFM